MFNNTNFGSTPLYRVQFNSLQMAKSRLKKQIWRPKRAWPTCFWKKIVVQDFSHLTFRKHYWLNTSALWKINKRRVQKSNLMISDVQDHIKCNNSTFILQMFKWRLVTLSQALSTKTRWCLQRWQQVSYLNFIVFTLVDI